ncbi:Hypothetical protein POVR2_LOCUS254 [uncultured virus]|nr:Hypothetical protein POVR2_LOCUS254 [uncultured virus]
MIKDARDHGLSKMDPSQLDMAKTMLKAAKPEDLIVAFIGKEKFWKAMLDKKMSFLENDIGVIFSDSGIIEAAVVEEPVKIFLQLQKWKTDVKSRPEASKRAIDYSDPFIGERDIEVLWNRLRLMIKCSCKWNAANGKKYKLSAYDHIMNETK